MELRIDRLWDGTPARADEVWTLRLDGGPGALEIRVDAPFFGDPAPAAAAGPLMGLWDYEVAELFILGDDDHYTEIELGPFGHHLVLRLHGRRNPVEACLPLDYQVHREGARFFGLARLDRALLPKGPHRVNAYAIHGVGAERRYLAWEPVPGEEPDFHRLECFRPVTLFT
jgi:hypothetical protein